jgi:hypothetical protein
LNDEAEQSRAVFLKARELLHGDPDHAYEYVDVLDFVLTGGLSSLLTTDDVDPETGRLYEPTDPSCLGWSPGLPPDISNAESVFYFALGAYYESHTKLQRYLHRHKDSE